MESTISWELLGVLQWFKGQKSFPIKELLEYVGRLVLRYSVGRAFVIPVGAQIEGKREISQFSQMSHDERLQRLN